MSASDTTTPMIGTNGTQGVLNGRGRSGSRTRRIHTPAQTIVKANSVPMLVSSARSRSEALPPAWRHRCRPTIVEMYGVRNFGWILLAHFHRSPSLRHRVEDARLSQQHDQHGRAEAADGADLHQHAAPLTPATSTASAIGSATFSCV